MPDPKQNQTGQHAAAVNGHIFDRRATTRDETLDGLIHAGSQDTAAHRVQFSLLLSRSCPFCLLKGGGWKNLWTPFLNPCSLLNSNEQGKETRVPELSKEEGMIVCKQGGQEVTPGG